MSNLGILYIATGNYKILFDDFFNSCEKYFCNTIEKNYYIFTDNINYFKKYGVDKNIIFIHIKHLEWPFPTLFRYKYFIENADILNQSDYLIFCNANLKFIDDINFNELFASYEMFVTLHPGYYNKKSYQFDYEGNIKSEAYIAPREHSVYVCGGFNGGRTDLYLNMSKDIHYNILLDLGNQIIAKWHDESHLNKYVDVNVNLFNIISEQYCCPEYNIMISKPKVIVRNKIDYFSLTDRGVRYVLSSTLKKYLFKIYGRFIK